MSEIVAILVQDYGPIGLLTLILYKRQSEMVETQKKILRALHEYPEIEVGQ